MITGIDWKHYYGVNGPRSPPVLYMHKADNIGQVHHVESKEGFWLVICLYIVLTLNYIIITSICRNPHIINRSISDIIIINSKIAGSAPDCFINININHRNIQ